MLTTLDAGAPPAGEPAATTDAGAGCGEGSIVTRATSSGGGDWIGLGLTLDLAPGEQVSHSRATGVSAKRG